MPQPRLFRRAATALAACAALTLASMSSAWAYYISTTPTLPVLGAAYASSTGAGCFPNVPPLGVCVEPGTFVLTSLVSSTFDADSQNIVTNASYTGALTTNVGHLPLGMVNLLGTIEQEVYGRTAPDQLGTWNTEIITLSLTGSIFGRTLHLSLDPAHPGESRGTTSIVSVGSPRDELFRIDSFFDVFVELTLEATAQLPELRTTRGPISAALVPEPSSLALLAGGLVAFASRRRRKVAAG